MQNDPQKSTTVDNDKKIDNDPQWPTKSPKRTTKTHIDKKVSTYSNQKQSSTTQDIIWNYPKTTCNNTKKLTKKPHYPRNRR